jgi:hypothetical protein
MNDTTPNRIYGGIVFDSSKANYVEWKDSLYAFLRFLQLSRWAIPLTEGELGVKKAKPVGNEEKIEEWEDASEKALAVVSESLGSLRWLIKDCTTPDAALKVMHDQYSGATKRDSVKLETQWVTEKPKGNSFLEYISVMTRLRDKLKAVGVTKTDKELCLRMMMSLAEYEEDHPLRDAFKQLKHKMRDAPDDVTLTYFTNYIQMTMEDINEDTQHGLSTKNDATMHSLLAMTRLADRMEQVLAMRESQRNDKAYSRPGNTPESRNNYTGCHFCKSMTHQIANCDHPKFDVAKWKRDREAAQRSRGTLGGPGKGSLKDKGRGRSGERSNWVEEDDEGDVAPVTGSTMKMKNAVDVYGKIGSSPSPGIDTGVAYKGGATSLTPCVRSHYPSSEVEQTDVADEVDIIIHDTSESISEQLFNAVLNGSDSDVLDTILDSGCTRTMWKDRAMFETSPNYRECRIDVRVGDGFIIQGKGMGNVTLFSKSGLPVIIPDCLWVPELKLNLVSVSHLDSEGFTTTFQGGTAAIARDGLEVLSGTRRSNLYHLDMNAPISVEAHVTSDVIHKRLGHFAARKLKRLFSLVDGLDEIAVGKLPLVINCESCICATSKRSAFPLSKTVVSRILELLHMDLAGPAEVTSLGAKRYMLIIADDHSRYYHTILLNRKSEAFDRAKEWIALQERRTGLKVKRIRTDGGGEFVGAAWKSYYAERGIAHETTVPYSAEQNGRAERAVGIVKNGTRTYLIESGLSKSYWGAAAVNFTYTRNMITTAANPGITPYEMFLGKKPNVGHLRVFGCVAWVHIPKETRKGAWSPRARKMVFVGYAWEQGTKGWVFYDPEKRERVVSIHTTFWENVPWSKRNLDPDMRLFEDDGDDVLEIEARHISEPVDVSPDPDMVMPVTPRRSSRPRQAPIRLGQYANAAQVDAFQELACLLSMNLHQPTLDVILELAYHASAEQDHRHPRFLPAKRKELNSMFENQVWELVPLPPGERAIGSRWLCSDKLLADLSTMEKARLVVLGHLQRAGKDYQEIFAPVLKMESVRLLLAMIVKYDMHFVQGDVKTAFLYGPLEEVVYMRQPPGFEEKGKEDWVCRLKKAIYGLHQAPRAFYKHITGVLLKAGFQSIHGDPSIFVRYKDGHRSFIGLYVDDAIIASTSSENIAETKDFLMQHFKMTWTETPKMLLGIQLERDRDAGTMRISQEHYADEILKTFNMENCTPKKYPMLKALPAHNGSSKPAPDRRFPYLEFIGKLNYLARSTRPDLSFVASHLATFCSSYQEEHWEACKDVMRYIKGTMNASIVFRRDTPSQPVGYSDADYATNPGDRKSVSGYGFMYAGGMISWRSKKQPVVAHSSSESELIALDAAAREGLWLASLFQQLSRPVQLPMQLWEDNQGTINVSKNPVNHVGMKHIDVRYFAIRNWIQENKLRVDYLQTSDMLADAFTKPLNGARLRTLCEAMGMDFRKHDSVGRRETGVPAAKGSVVT